MAVLENVKLSPKAKSTAWALSIRARLKTEGGHDAGTAWPSRKTIADDIDMCVRTVGRALEELEEAGLIERTQRYGDGGQISTLYRLLVRDSVTLTEPAVKDSASPVKDSVSAGEGLCDPLTLERTKERTLGGEGLCDPHRQGEGYTRPRRIEDHPSVSPDLTADSSSDEGGAQ